MDRAGIIGGAGPINAVILLRPGALRNHDGVRNAGVLEPVRAGGPHGGLGLAGEPGFNWGGADAGASGRLCLAAELVGFEGGGSAGAAGGGAGLHGGGGVAVRDAEGEEGADGGKTGGGEEGGAVGGQVGDLGSRRGARGRRGRGRC